MHDVGYPPVWVVHSSNQCVAGCVLLCNVYGVKSLDPNHSIGGSLAAEDVENCSATLSKKWNPFYPNMCATSSQGVCLFRVGN